MAFIRKRGDRYYLVHNVRKKGQVRQIHLARLGRRPHVSQGVIEEVKSRHPFVEVDWQGLREQASRELVKPFERNSSYLRDMLRAVENLSLDVAELHLPVLEATVDAELVRQLIAALKLLQTTVDVKLSQRRRTGALPVGR